MAFKMTGFSGFKKNDTFEKIAKSRAEQNKIIQKDLESKGYTFSDSKKSASRGNIAKGVIKPRKKIAKKIIKKVGSRLIPGLGTIALAADVVKEVRLGGAGIRKNIKDVKKFLKK